MKLPAIPLPDPVFMVCLPPVRPGWRQAVLLGCARIVLWFMPSGTAEMVLIHVHGPHPAWLILLATYTILAIMVFLIGACVDDEEAVQ